MEVVTASAHTSPKRTHPTVWLNRREGPQEVTVVLPTHWQGECGCVVGPFSSQAVASYYANTVVDFGYYERFSERVFARGDAWYVEILMNEGT